MSVSGITSSSGLTAADWQSTFKQVRTDFKSLSDALSSGDLGTAQQAYAQLQKDLPASAASSSSSNASNPLAAVGQALQSGDIASAQKALASMRTGHRGHHHHPSADAASPAPASATPSSSDPDGPGSLLNSVA